MAVAKDFIAFLSSSYNQNPSSIDYYLKSLDFVIIQDVDIRGLLIFAFKKKNKFFSDFSFHGDFKILFVLLYWGRGPVMCVIMYVINFVWIYMGLCCLSLFLIF